MTMLVFDDIQSLQQYVRAQKAAGKRIGFVPTMGNLHQGHLTLCQHARQRADIVISSIFVNPMQFNNAQDLANYPRTESQDQQALASVGVDALFLPTVTTMYPNGVDAQTFVEVPTISYLLEGALRPGHFRGVATVVSKLFNMVQPDVACFGEKDFQQLALIRQMVADMAYPIEIVGVPTVREADGLAMSSRNGYLTPQERQLAPLLAEVMRELARLLANQGKLSTADIEQAAAKLNQGGFRTDAIDVVDANSLQALSADSQQAVILMAAFLGKARLIDNQVVRLRD